MAASLANDSEARDLRNTKRSQSTLVLLASLTHFSIGTYIAWPSVGLPILDQNDEFPSSQGASWLCASVALGAIIGSVPTGTIVDRISRKRGILISSLLLSSCWFVIAFVRSKLWVFVARFVAGLSCGASSILVPIHLSELVTNCARESLWTILQLQMALGILFTYCISFTNSLILISFLSALASDLLSITIRLIPESPSWLISQGNQSAAEKILAYYGKKNFTEDEMSRQSGGINELWNHRRATITAIGMMVFQQLSGMNTLISNAATIFQYIRFPLSPTSCSIIVGLTYVIATLSSRSLIDRTKRKLLLFLSLSVMSVSMFILSGYFRLQNTENVTSFSWLPCLALLTFVGAFGVGCGPVPWILIEKIFPDDVKMAAISVIIVCNWISAFIAIKLFQDLLYFIGISSTFAAYGMVSLIGTAFIAIFVPETEGKTVEEIQAELNKEDGTTAFCI